MKQKWPEPRTGKSASTLGTLLSGVCYGRLNLHPSTMARTGSTPFCPLPPPFLPASLPHSVPPSLLPCLPLSFSPSFPSLLPSFPRANLRLSLFPQLLSLLYLLILCYSLLTLQNLHLPMFLFLFFYHVFDLVKILPHSWHFGAVSYPFSCLGGLFFFFRRTFKMLSGII